MFGPPSSSFERRSRQIASGLLANVGCPIFLMNGEKDRNTRPEDARLLFSHAQSRKELWFVSNAGHVDLHKAATAEYESRVLAFLAQM